MRRSALVWLLLLGCAGSETRNPAPAAAPGSTHPPKLVVAILVDGLGQHQLDRFGKQFGEGGFRRFLDQGAWYNDARYGHSTTITAVGHGTWLTGAYPYRHGMVSNDWYDRKTKKLVYCTEDPDSKLLGEVTKERQGTSPRNLLVTTVGDELRAATAMKSRVFTASLKDRGAILPAGHLGTAFWFSPQTGRFITSDYYRREMPEWWLEWHLDKPQNRYFGREWSPLFGDEAYEGTFEGQPQIRSYKGLGKQFPHKVTGGKEAPGPDYYGAIEGTPFGHELLAEFAKTMIRQEGLGRNPAGVPDLVAVSFSSHDFINHLFGPESKESADDLLRLDRVLADLFRFLDGWMGPDGTLICLTADHGFSPSPEYWHDVMKIDAGRINAGDLLKKLNEHLSAKFGLGKYASAWRLPTIWLDYDLIDERKLGRADVEAEAAQFLSAVPGVAAVFTRTQLSEGRVPATRLGTLVSRSWHPRISGDLLLIQKEGSFFIDGVLQTFTAMHGSPWTYDARVPVLFQGAPWIRQGKVLQAAEPADIAPTLAEILGVPPPSGSEGRALAEILR